ncbi:MAG TPA: acyl-CoA dehydrogenase family protein [Rugosimonospora sp.]|nr:acyl-CoA dehydrogenase family protein [Rugosimonospora sp.]
MISHPHPRVAVSDPVRAVTELAGTVFAGRAAEYDATGQFPAADFQDLCTAGLNAPTVPTEYGGLGLGPYRRRTYPLWMMTAALAEADLSLARCWEGHANSLMLIDALGTEAQRQLWFDGVVRGGEIWVAWSGEPQAPKPGEKPRFGTRLTRVDDGWLLNGSKAFATSAAGADHAILLVDPTGAGGARYGTGAADSLLLLACDLAQPSVSVDTSWWDPIGMRATGSHVVRFADTYIADSAQIGKPGDYLRYDWQTALIPHYAASYLGAARAAYRYALDYVRHQAKERDPYVQHRIGTMAVHTDTAAIWLAHVAELWDRGAREEAMVAGVRARHAIEQLAQSTVDNCIRACGARSLIRPSPVERVLRDLSLYLRHDNDDHVLATIGRAALGVSHDRSFFKP